MLRENIEKQCRKISPDYEEKTICAFAPRDGRTGFIDTSGAGDGTRGIAFFGDRIFVNFDGSPHEILYGKIKRTYIISSFEDAFADELSIVCERSEFRISDYSLDKFELKRFLDELCKEYEQNIGQFTEQTEKYAEIIAQKLSGDAPSSDLSAAKPVIEIAERSMPPKDYTPQPIPDEKIDWLNGEKNENSRPKLEVMSGVMEPGPVFSTTGSQKLSDVKAEGEASSPSEPQVFEEELSETEMREKIENMSTEQMMKFLSGTLSEINENISEQEEPKADNPVLLIPEPFPEENKKITEVKKSRWEKLTAEPIWGDIYIKASQNLRELCESGKLTMEQMEDEIKARLLTSAEAFEKIISNENRVPKVMIPKIEELKSAAENFDRYFEFGEDIAIRAMFFMQYQMLTYADRIEESPETKDRLNDFFRRFGTAGITLSMLDMRV